MALAPPYKPFIQPDKFNFYSIKQIIPDTLNAVRYPLNISGYAPVSASSSGSSSSSSGAIRYGKGLKRFKGGSLGEYLLNKIPFGSEAKYAYETAEPYIKRYGKQALADYLDVPPPACPKCPTCPLSSKQKKEKAKRLAPRKIDYQDLNREIIKEQQKLVKNTDQSKKNIVSQGPKPTNSRVVKGKKRLRQVINDDEFDY